MKHLAMVGLLAAALALLANAATAQVAYTAKSVHLRAGPARDYPVVAVLPAGDLIAIQGCLQDYSWCDVTVGVNRGWVYAANITYTYEGTAVPVQTYGPQLGLAVFGFILGDYWFNHYRERPWYPDRQRWIHLPVPHHPPTNRPPLPRPGFSGPGAEHHNLPPRAAPNAPRPPQRTEPGRPPQQAPHGIAPGGARQQPPQGGAHQGQRSVKPRPADQPLFTPQEPK